MYQRLNSIEIAFTPSSGFAAYISLVDKRTTNTLVEPMEPLCSAYTVFLGENNHARSPTFRTSHPILKYGNLEYGNLKYKHKTAAGRRARAETGTTHPRRRADGSCFTRVCARAGEGRGVEYE